jgi:hypothetical protein
MLWVLMEKGKEKGCAVLRNGKRSLLVRRRGKGRVVRTRKKRKRRQGKGRLWSS